MTDSQISQARTLVGWVCGALGQLSAAAFGTAGVTRTVVLLKQAAEAEAFVTEAVHEAKRRLPQELPLTGFESHTRQLALTVVSQTNPFKAVVRVVECRGIADTARTKNEAVAGHSTAPEQFENVGLLSCEPRRSWERLAPSSSPSYFRQSWSAQSI